MPGNIVCSAHVEYCVNGTGKFATAQVPCTSYRGVQIPGTRWCLVFVGLQCGTCFMCVMVPRILRCLLGFWKIRVSLKWYVISWSSRKLHFHVPLSNPFSQATCSKYYLVMAGLFALFMRLLWSFKKIHIWFKSGRSIQYFTPKATYVYVVVSNIGEKYKRELFLF